jgi:hypothetical protein
MASSGVMSQSTELTRLKSFLISLRLLISASGIKIKTKLLELNVAKAVPEFCELWR